MLCTLLALSVLANHFAVQSDPTLPPGFVVETIGSDWAKPVALSIVDGSRMLVAEKRGRLWYVENRVKRNQVIDLSTEILSNGDRGMLGVAVDPQFDLNGRVYLMYEVDPDADGTDTDPHAFTRLVRFTTAHDAAGNLVADPSSRVTLLGASWPAGIPSIHLGHAAGALAFLGDGSLVVSHGDGAHFNIVDEGGHDPNGFGPGKSNLDQDLGAFRALEQSSLAGKVLRLDPATGLGLADNPFFTGNPADLASRVWATGLRNPYRFTLVPGTGPLDTLFVCDVGSAQWEEIDLCRGGECFGWPCHEGEPELSTYQANDPHGYCDAVQGQVTAPWLAWNHTVAGSIGFTGDCASGACIYGGTSYPQIYRGALFFCDYARGWMKVATLDANLNRTAILPFGTNMGSPIDIERDPLTGDLVYISLADQQRILRLRYAPANLPPVAVLNATPTWGTAPLTVQFSAQGSHDPEGDPLTYHWDLGDGTSATTPQVTKVYGETETYTVVLTVSDNLANQGSATVVISSNNTPPVIVSVASPTDGDVYEEGVPIVVAAAATDAEDGAAEIPLQAQWEFDMVHDHHVHPGWSTIMGFSGSWTPETHGDGSHALLLTLTVTDSRGLTDTRTFTLYDHEAEPFPHVTSVADALTIPGRPVVVRAHVDYATPPGQPAATLTFDWGDGTQDILPDSAHQVERVAEHVYAAYGSRELTVTAALGGVSHASVSTIEVRRPTSGVAVFQPLQQERYVAATEQETIADELWTRLGYGKVARFSWNEQAELIEWMQANMGGELDVLVLMDLAPSGVFAGQADGSLAEQWLESGEGIVWTGAAPFAESIDADGTTTTWGEQAVDGLLDAAPGSCSGAGLQTLAPLAALLPSLLPDSALHAVRLDRLGASWQARRVFATGSGAYSDAVQLRHDSGGLYAQFCCVPAGGSSRAGVLSEFLANVMHSPVRSRSERPAKDR